MTDRTIYADTPEAGARASALLAAHEDPQWNAGCAEPWIANLLAALVRASDPATVVEIGGFEGYTSRALARALRTLPHNTSLTVCEIDEQRARSVEERLECADAFGVECHVVCADSLKWIPTLANGSVDFVWLDGNHEKVHVAQEIALLLPKLAPGGLICGHDVFGVCDLREVFAHFGGYSLNLCRLGLAGGLGILQRQA